MFFQVLLAPQLNRFINSVLLTSALHLLLVSPTQAQEVDSQHVDFTFFCSRFSSNSICQDSSSLAQQVPAFSDQANQLIRLRLDVSGTRDEWIRIETRNLSSGETSLTAYHTKRVRQGLLSNLASGLLSFGLQELANEAIDGYSGPVPSPGINFYGWADHQTRRIVFIPDGCSDETLLLSNNPLPSCTITGIDSMMLPSEVDISSGSFILEYQEQELVRAVTFRVTEEDL